MQNGSASDIGPINKIEINGKDVRAIRFAEWGSSGTNDFWHTNASGRRSRKHRQGAAGLTETNVRNRFNKVLTFTFLVSTAFAQQQVVPLKIDIINLEGNKIGTATFSEAATGGVKLDLDIQNMHPGLHIFHIHNQPVCDPKTEFDSTQLRFDPTHHFYGDKEHHIAKTAEPSAGDPGKGIEIKADGTGQGTFYMPHVSMGSADDSILRGDGTAITFHAAEGEEGATRVACGVIRKK